MFNQFTPDYAIHPGEYLEEVLESRDMKKKDFANRCGISVKAVSQIINGKSLFTSDVALQFERVLGIQADLLMNLVSSFQIFETRRKDKELLKQKGSWLKNFPEKELIKYKIIPQSDDIYEKADNLLDFFNVSNPDTWKDYYSEKAVSFRESPKFKYSLESTTTWLRIGEKISESIECNEFDKEQFKTSISEIRSFTTLEPEIFSNRMIDLCKQSGVALVFVPELKDTHISGATKWISSNKALIIMSLGYKTNDHFWFTFFHEAGHILLHSKKDVFIDSRDNTYSKNEVEANKFAKNLLISPEKYTLFVKSGNFNKDRIVKFANENNIAPGIVVGLLQHDEHIQYSWQNDLKQKLEINVEV